MHAITHIAGWTENTALPLQFADVLITIADRVSEKTGANPSIMVAASVVMTGIAIASYVIGSVAHHRILKYMGHKSPWLAWVPIMAYCALADVAFPDRFRIMRFWWLPIMTASLLKEHAMLAKTAIMMLFLGICYASIYAKLERKEIKKTIFIGMTSAIIGIVPIIKFMAYGEDARIERTKHGL